MWLTESRPTWTAGSEPQGKAETWTGTPEQARSLPPMRTGFKPYANSIQDMFLEWLTTHQQWWRGSPEKSASRSPGTRSPGSPYKFRPTTQPGRRNVPGIRHQNSGSLS